MPTTYTSSLGLALPVTGELSGTWGDTVNDYITKYVDAAVAGAQTISGSQTAVTLSTTNGGVLTSAGSGATGSAQYAIINCTGNPAGLLTITAPAVSKAYLVLNNTSTNQSVKVVATGPTTGVTVAASQAALIAWMGTDFELVASTDINTLSGVLATAKGGTGLSTFTAANNALYSTSASVLTAGTLPVAAGGTGATTLTGYVKGSGTTAFTASASVPVADISGTLPVGKGGTGLATLPAASIPVVNTLDTLTTVVAGASQSIRRNAGNTAWEAYTPSTASGDVTAAGNNAFTGANTFYNATGQTFGTATATQDGIIVAGRAGGTSSFRLTLQPTTLTASQTLTLPNATGTVLATTAAALGNNNLTGIKNATFNAQNTIATTTGAITVDWNTAQNQLQTEPTGTITYTFTAPPGPCHLQLLINSDGTSTAQTINWPGTVIQYGQTWAGVNNKRAVINFWYDGTNYHMIGTNQA